MMNGNNGNYGHGQTSTPNSSVNMPNSASTSAFSPDGYLGLGLLDDPLAFPTTPVATFAPQAPTLSSSWSMPFHFQAMATSIPRRPHFRRSHPCRFPPVQPPPPQHLHQHHQHHQLHPQQQHQFQHQHQPHQIQHQIQHPNPPFQQGPYPTQPQQQQDAWSFPSTSAPILPTQQTSYFPMAPSSTYSDLVQPLSPSVPTSTWGTQHVYRMPEPSQMLSPAFHPLSPGSPSSPQSLALSPTSSSSNRGSIDNAVDLQMLMLSMDENAPPTFSPTPLQLLQAPMTPSGTTSSTCVNATPPTMESPLLPCSSDEDTKDTSRSRSKCKYQSSVKERLNKKIRQRQRKANHLEGALPSHTHSTSSPCCSSETQCPSLSSSSGPSTSTLVSTLTAAWGAGEGDGSVSNDPRSPSSEPSLRSSSPSPPPSVSSPPPSASQGLKFICEYCDRPFERQYNLNAHIRTHTDARIHQCDICRKAFLRPYDLSRHQRIHNNIRPYTCQLCGRVFIRNDAIWRHYRSNHADHPDVPISRFEKRKSQAPP